MRAAVLLLALLALLGLALASAQSQPAAQSKSARVTPPQPGANDGPDDVHVFLKQVVEGDAAGARVAEAEQRFHANHARVMRRLDKLAAKIGQQPTAANAALVEVEAEAEAPIVPIIDDTGSAVEIPRANLTQFKVKPAIDPRLVQDSSLARIEAESDARRAQARAAHRAFIDRMRARVASVFGVPTQAPPAPATVQPAFVAPSVSFESLAPPAVPSTPPPAVPILLETEAEAESESESDSWVDAELTESGSPMIDAEISAIELQAEAEAPIVPIIDDTGSAVEIPRANLTQFKVKPAIDPRLVQDAPVARLEAEDEARRLKRAAAVDSMKQRIQAAWAAAAQLHAPPALSSFGPPPVPVPAAVPGSLLETQSGDCPTCANGSKRQSHRVVYNHGSDALIDRPLIEEQHKRVDYMLGEARSIAQRDLDAARTQLSNSNGVREDVQDLLERNQNQPLIPRD